MQHRAAQKKKKTGGPICDGVLSAEILSCSNLIGADRNGLSDPFVTVQLGEASARTKHKKKTLNPTYNETLQLDVKASTGDDDDLAQIYSLVVAVFDNKDVTSSDFLGDVAMDLSQFGWVAGDRKQTNVALGDSAGKLVSSEPVKQFTCSSSTSFCCSLWSYFDFSLIFL